jgi:hypothetical protein
MLAWSLVEEVRRLLAEGKWSQRKIAKQLGISRGTIGAIAQGKRAVGRPQPQEGDEEWHAEGPPERCPCCGQLVYPPCRLCRIRAVLAKASRPRLPEMELPLEASLRLDLNPEHQARYEEIRRLDRPSFPHRERHHYEYG